MKKCLLLGLLVCFTLAAKARNDSSDIVKVGQPMPAFTIVFDNGQKLSSAEWKGKVTLVVFFATWCPPCQKELAYVQQDIWEKYKDEKDFRLVVIGREHSDAELAEYKVKKGFTFPLYPDKNRKIFGLFARNLIPRSYLIEKGGKVVYTMKGYTPVAFDRLQKKIAESL